LPTLTIPWRYTCHIEIDSKDDQLSSNLRKFANDATNSSDSTAASEALPKKNEETRKIANTSLEATAHYRQNQLKGLNDRFTKNTSNSSSDNSQSSLTMSSWWSSKPLEIDNYEDVQPMWKDMESRVSKRRLPPKLTEVKNDPIARSVYVGRRNIRKTEEEEWLAAGLYENEKTEKK